MRPGYHLRVITPKGIAYAGDVVHTLVPAENGFVGVLAHHAPYVTSSPGGEFRLREQTGAIEGEEKAFCAGPGFFTVASNQAFFLTESFSAPAGT